MNEPINVYNMTEDELADLLLKRIRILKKMVKVYQ